MYVMRMYYAWSPDFDKRVGLVSDRADGRLPWIVMALTVSPTNVRTDGQQSVDEEQQGTRVMPRRTMLSPELIVVTVRCSK